MTYILIFFGVIILFALVNYLMGFDWNKKANQRDNEKMKKAIKQKEDAFKFIKEKYKIVFSQKRFEEIYCNIDYKNEDEMKEFLIKQSYSSIYKTVKTKSKKETKIKLTDEQKYWLNLVNIRVNALPFDFIERTYTVDSMGEEHASEYINNEFKVPKDKRKEVALSRIEGLSSIRDYIKSKGSKKQKFHYESSLKGALLYASSLGINIDKS